MSKIYITTKHHPSLKEGVEVREGDIQDASLALECARKEPWYTEKRWVPKEEKEEFNKRT